MSERTKLRRRDPSHSPMDQLRQQAIDVQALANTLQARAARLSTKAARLREKARQAQGGETFSITDHALVQYCKRYLGMDMEGHRNEIARILVEKATPMGLAKDAVIWKAAKGSEYDGIAFIVVRGRLVVTSITTQQIENIDPALLELAEREGFEPPDEV